MTAGAASMVRDAGVVPARPLDGPGRWLRIAPFVAIAAVGIILALTDPAHDNAGVVAAAGVLVAIVAAVGLLPWRRWPAGWQALPALGFYPISGILAYAAGEHTEFIFLTALPVIWLVMYHSRRLVVLGLVLLAGVLFVPPLLSPGSTPQHWSDVIMAFALSGFGGLAGHYLVSRSRATAAEAAAATRRAQADQDMLAAYLDNAGAMVVVLDRAGRVTLFNRFAERVSGYRQENLIGHTLWALGRDPGGARQAFEQVLATGGPIQYTGDWVISSGEVRRVAWTANGMVDEAGQVTHVIGNGTDITEKINTQRLFTNVLGAATEHMIAATDRHGTFTVFNVGAERLLGYRAEEVIGRLNTEDIHLPEELQALADEVGAPSFRALLDYPPVEEEVVDAREWTLVRKDGGHVPVAMAVHSLRDEGRSVGYVLTARDISAERAAQAATIEALERERQAAERLRELDQVKSDFVATVSHDLRTPLTSIIGNTELLLDGDAGQLNGTQQRLMQALDRNARRLDSLVGDLLLLSRIESGTLRMNLRPVSLQEVVGGALEAVAAKRTSDVEMEVGTPAEPALVQGDLDQLERVATNLLSNALKFTPPGGKVEVMVDADPNQVRLRISDTGVGIPPDELPHVFDRFFRSSRSQKQQSPGTGLGLTIAKSIVEQHGGSIAASAGPTGGTTFTIVLPRLPAMADLSEKERA